MEVCREYSVNSFTTICRGQYMLSFYQKKARNIVRPELSQYDENSITRWILETTNGLTKSGLVMISESVRAYAYLKLSSQAAT